MNQQNLSDQPKLDQSTFDQREPNTQLHQPASTVSPNIEAEQMPTTPEGRVARWQNKLLDLSLRNRLLNCKRSINPSLCKCN